MSYKPTYLQFDFPLDEFQNIALEGIDNEKNILVTAHTGSGKTVVAEYAIAKCLYEKKNVVYTSPIKTLSNQKFKDFSDKFGKDNVGILTGDIKVNPTASIVIMTAEILRNAIYRDRLESQKEDLYDYSFNPDRVDTVVFDEVHYINDPSRGKVWEEIILNLPVNVKLVMLSATINGAQKFADWISGIKQRDTILVSTNTRPVPLKHYIYYENKLHKILVNENEWDTKKYTTIYNELSKDHINKINMVHKSIDLLKRINRLPAIYFVLNRMMTEKYAESVPYNMLTHEETAQVTYIFNKHLHPYKNTLEKTEQWHMIYKLVSKGIAVHHSGIIPLLKEVVEVLFSQGLIKILFATETFAIGVNMPTKAVIFTSLEKYDGSNNRYFRTDEYKQMAGRAGRRGKDKHGDVIILPLDNLPTESECKNICIGNLITLSSKFAIDHSLILKLLSYNVFDVDDICNNINSSYMGLQNKLETSSMETQTISEIECLFTNDEEIILKRWIELDDMCNSGIINGFAISGKSMKKYKQEFIKYKSTYSHLENKINNYIEYSTMQNKKNELEQHIKYNKTMIDIQTNLILDDLRNLQYINNDNKLLPCGIVANGFNEINPLWITEIIKHKILDDLSLDKIGCILSIFICSDSKEKYVSDLDVPLYIKNKIKQIDDLAEIMSNHENKLNKKLPIPIHYDWTIRLSLVESTMMWLNGAEFSSIKHSFDMFEGNFIKDMLRLCNVFRNLIIVTKLNNDVILLNKIINIEEKILRDVVTTQSLYVN
jgi:superfamily II RNA helicase